MSLWLRTTLIALAVLIGASALWTLTIELTRPSLAYFPTNFQEAEQFDRAKVSAANAATIGMIRGDLWIAAAVTATAHLMFSDQQPRGTSKENLQSAEDVTQRAAKLSPHDSRLWLVLADLRSRTSPPAPNAAEALKLSYYTNPNDFDLAPLRLSVAARLNPDQDLQDAMQSEIQRILLKRMDLRDAIAAAYKAANAQSRQIFEATLEDADPSFLATMRAAPPRR